MMGHLAKVLALNRRTYTYFKKVDGVDGEQLLHDRKKLLVFDYLCPFGTENEFTKQ